MAAYEDDPKTSTLGIGPCFWDVGPKMGDAPRPYPQKWVSGSGN